MPITHTLLCIACQLASVSPAFETAPVESLEDAADDAAVWVNREDAAESRILGTDKRAGLRVYDFSGEEVAFAPVGRLNNVDLSMGVHLEDWSGDLAAASNRSDDSIALFSVAADGASQIGTFSVAPEPYGFCMGRDDGDTILFVAHKQGFVQPYRLEALGRPPVSLPPIYFDTQIEGCVYDPKAHRLFVGEETRGVWSVPFSGGQFDHAKLALVDVVGGASQLTADVEGLTIYDGDQRYLIASSQGDNRFHFYDLNAELAFVGAISVRSSAACKVDGAQDTDGVEAMALPLPGFPEGVLVVQDGFNVDAGVCETVENAASRARPQNFKVIDWRDVRQILSD